LGGVRGYLETLLLLEYLELVLAQRVGVGAVESVQRETQFALQFLWAGLAAT
jgi:hypothetical protein